MDLEVRKARGTEATAGPEDRRRIGAVLGRPPVEHATMFVFLCWWVVPFTRAFGGRGVHNELLFTLVSVGTLLATRVWRAPFVSSALASLVAVTACLVCVLAPTHWYGSDVAAGYVLGAAAYVVARRYVRSDERRNLVAAAVCLAGVYQFSVAFQPWWGGRDSSVEMTGTFYWHNPYAAFLLPGVIVGLGLVLGKRSPWTTVGWVSVPLCSAGIVFSSSRATMAAGLVGVFLVIGISVRNRSGGRRVAAVIAIAALVSLVLPGPPFFPSRHSPLAATTQRSDTGQSLSQNGEYRTELWRSAIEVAEHHPIIGSGFHALATDSVLYTRSGWARSPFAHNGYLQALSDGGLVLGLSFLIGAAICAGWALRRIWAGARRQFAHPADLVGISAAVALLAAFAHSAVDFDWSYPSIMVEAALLAAVVAPSGAAHSKRGLTWRFAPVSVLVAGLALMVPALHQWQIDQPAARDATSALLARGSSPFGDYRPASTVLRGIAQGTRPATTAEAREALRQTGDEATVDLHLALLRDAVGAKTGLLPNAVALALDQLRRIDGSTAPYARDLSLVYLESGDIDSARRTLQRDLDAQAFAGTGAPDLYLVLNQWARDFGTGPAYACEVRLLGPILDSAASSTYPAPTARCVRDRPVATTDQERSN